MKKACLFGMFFFCVCMHVDAQKIHYSRQTVKKLYTDDLQLVTNITGHHHLLRFNVNKEPVIYIYNDLLQLQGESKVDYKLKEKAEASVLPFLNYYYLYMHPAGTSRHALYKIDGIGNAEALTAAFQQVVDTVLNKSTLLQLVNQNNKLYAIAHVYYDAIKKIGSTVVELNNELKPVSVQKVYFNFNVEEDALRQTMLAGNYLLVLKTTTKEEGGQSLDVVRIELATGKSIIKSFNSANSRYVSTGFRLHPKDSTILVHAMLGVGGGARTQSNGFISVLSQSLEELTPFALFQSQFRNNADASYFLLDDYACWLNLTSGSLRRVRRIANSAGQNDWDDYPLHYFSTNEYPYSGPGLPANSQVSPSSAQIQYNLQQQPANRNRYVNSNPRQRTSVTDYELQSRVNFTVVNNRLKAIKDSVVSVKKFEFGIQSTPAAQVLLHNKPRLFLIQNFSESRRRLLMMSAGTAGQLAATDINVYDKYEYLLEQLQGFGNHSVILPYVHKNEAGLLKISFD
jgi:hypothetical protein